MEPVTQKKTVDRVVLGLEQAEKIDAFVDMLKTRFSGMLKPSRADIVNFLIDKHDANLSETELMDLKSRLYSEVRFISWALSQLRQAKQKGIKMTLDDLRAQADHATQAPRRGRKLKNNGEMAPSQFTSPDANTECISSDKLAGKPAPETGSTDLNLLETHVKE